MKYIVLFGHFTVERFDKATGCIQTLRAADRRHRGWQSRIFAEILAN
jgi:hypothetical protein